MSKRIAMGLGGLLLWGALLVPAMADELSDWAPRPYVELQHPAWTRDAVIYEVNVRQYTPEGTFSAFAGHLPRLKRLGVDILWLMPVHPIGERNRKGGLGSAYSVRDFLALNPDYGTPEDFRALVAEIHALGMHVIIDWVANHSAWDNPLATEHPEWYSKNAQGDFQPTPWVDWSDVIDFDYTQPGLRRYMVEAMGHWVREYDIDGFRCDAAGYVPLDFWERARSELDRIKPVFMLAEWESRDLHRRAFDASYAWSLYDVLHQVGQGRRDAGALWGYLGNHGNSFPRDAMVMNFVDNHDKNSWEGTQFTQMRDALDPAIVLSVTAAGMPLVYSGQEAGLDRQLAFFEKDTITWREHRLFALYQQLFRLKKEHPALWNAHWGAPMLPVFNSDQAAVVSYLRQRDGDRVLTLLNFSASPADVALLDAQVAGQWRDAFDGAAITLAEGARVSLPPWSYRVLVAGDGAQ